MISSPSSANKVVGWFRYVSSAFSHTLGLTLTEGRDFTDDDYLAKSDGVIVNEILARSFWGNGTALGKRISLDSDQTYTVVGVFKDLSAPAIPITSAWRWFCDAHAENEQWHACTLPI